MGRYLLSDTAFASSLPQEARAFAIPLKWMRAGICKKPKIGIIHQWALRKAFGARRCGKVITILLDEHPNVVAFADGLPKAVSDGFGPTDGLMSSTACGWIDTSIVFQMFSDGYSPAKIRQVLSKESGFAALAGKKTQLAKDIFCYQILKCIGAYTAILEGLDAIIFISKANSGMRNFALDLIGQLKFMGLKKKNSPLNDILTAPTSSVGAYYLEYNK